MRYAAVAKTKTQLARRPSWGRGLSSFCWELHHLTAVWCASAVGRPMPPLVDRQLKPAVRNLDGGLFIAERATRQGGARRRLANESIVGALYACRLTPSKVIFNSSAVRQPILCRWISKPAASSLAGLCGSMPAAAQTSSSTPKSTARWCGSVTSLNGMPSSFGLSGPARPRPPRAPRGRRPVRHGNPETVRRSPKSADLCSVQLINMIAQAHSTLTGWRALHIALHQAPDVLVSDTVARHHLPDDQLAQEFIKCGFGWNHSSPRHLPACP